MSFTYFYYQLVERKEKYTENLLYNRYLFLYM